LTSGVQGTDKVLKDGGQAGPLQAGGQFNDENHQNWH